MIPKASTNTALHRVSFDASRRAAEVMTSVLSKASIPREGPVSSLATLPHGLPSPSIRLRSDRGTTVLEVDPCHASLDQSTVDPQLALEYVGNDAAIPIRVSLNHTDTAAKYKLRQRALRYVAEGLFQFRRINPVEAYFNLSAVATQDCDGVTIVNSDNSAFQVLGPKRWPRTRGYE